MPRSDLATSLADLSTAMIEEGKRVFAYVGTPMPCVRARVCVCAIGAGVGFVSRDTAGICVERFC